MKIKQINDQIRQDFWADYECEHCGYIEKNKTGYDDRYFHQNVIPEMKCPQCGKTAETPCYTRMVKTLKEMTTVQCRDGNWNYDAYTHGMTNGMIFALSIFEGGKPEYLEAPDVWLKDYEVCCECDELTGKAGIMEDSNFIKYEDGEEVGPLCDDCRNKRWVCEQCGFG